MQGMNNIQGDMPNLLYQSYVGKNYIGQNLEAFVYIHLFFVIFIPYCRYMCVKLFDKRCQNYFRGVYASISVNQFCD